MTFKSLLSLPAVALAALLCVPSSGFAQSILNTANNFVLLGGSAVTVAGAGPDVFSNGNVGSALSISGFPPATVVNGTTILGGAIVTQALNDLTTARTALSAMATTANLTGVNGGNLATQILTPGVYKFDAAAGWTANGILTLDAQGKNNVTWVFNIGTGMTTGANAQVVFINLGSNGGKDNGLFWNAGTTITFGATNVIAGNYLAGANIVFGTTVPATGSGSGRALAGAIVSFDGSATMDILGGPGGGDLAGGLAFDGLTLTTSGYVLLSSTGSYSPGISGLVLTPGTNFNTAGVTIDGSSSTKTGSASASLLVFGTSATLSGVNTYAGGTIVDGGQLIAGSVNLPTNGAITLTNSNGTPVVSSLVFNQTSNGTFGGAISGNGSVTKSGGSSLTLSGINTYTGGTTIGAGTLVITNATSLPGNVTNNSALVLDLAATGSFAGVISGTGNVTKTGVGTLTLFGANTYTGGTTVSAGTLALSANDRLANTGALTVSGGTFALGAFSDTVGAVSLVSGTISGTTGVLTGTSYSVESGTISAILAGAGALTKITTGTVTLAGANTYTGGTTVSAGTLVGTAASLQGALTNNATVVFDQAVAGTYAGAMTGTGAVLKQGVGTLTLSGANTYTGGTAVSAGTLALGASDRLANTGTLTVSGGTLALGTFSETVGALTLVSGSITGTTGVLTATSFDLQSGTVSAILGGTGSLIKSTGSTVTLSGANTYTGNTTITGGTLVFTNAAALPGNILNNSGLTFDSAAISTYGGIVSGTGSLTKAGTSSLTLSGANTYTGGTIITAGTLIASSTSLPTNGAVTNSGALTLNQTADGTFGGIVSGAGSLTKAGAATLTLSGANTYTGGTTISTGTLVASSSTLPANGNVANSGALTLNQTADGTFGGIVSGTGSLTKAGAATLTLSNANTYTGGTTVSAGTLSGDVAALPANQNVAIASGATLDFRQTADATFGGVLSGTGLVTKQGAGTLTLSAANTVALNLLAGSLFLASGSTVGTVSVSPGATFGGIGNVSGNFFNNGILSPGFSPGLIAVAGNFGQGPGGTLIMEIASPVSFDQLVITGTATLDGTLQIDLLGGYVPDHNQSFTILTAAGGRTGSFSSVTGTGAALSPNVTYNSNDVMLVFFTQLPFASFAGTPNQVAVGNAAQLSPGLTTALDAVPLVSQFPAALNALSPQGYEIWSDIAFARATSLARRLELRRNKVASVENTSTQTDEPADPTNPLGLYAELSQRRGRAAGDLDVRASTFTSNELLVGGDRVVGPDLTLGGFLSYGETNADLGSANSRTTIQDYTLGARAVWAQGPLFVHALFAYGFDDYDSSRPVVFPGTSVTAASSTHGEQWTAGITGGRDFMHGNMTLSPFVGVLVSGWRTSGFTETGAGAFNATLASQSSESLRTQVGLEGAWSLVTGSLHLRPRFRAAWVHEFFDDERHMNAAFGPVPFAVTTRGPQRDSALLSAGLDIQLSPRALLYMEFSAQPGTRTKILSEWRVGVSIGF
jgi:autotransporter-associated beta strand protein